MLMVTASETSASVGRVSVDWTGITAEVDMLINVKKTLLPLSSDCSSRNHSMKVGVLGGWLAFV